MKRQAKSSAVPAVVVAGLLLSVGPRSALAKNEQGPSGRVSASSRATAPEAAADVNPTFEITPNVEWRYFNWKEFGPNGVEQLTESGSLFVFGFDPKVAFGSRKRFFVETPTNFYLGKVDYDGALLNGAPYKSTTGYFGLELEPTAGYVFSLSQRFQLTPTAGLGFELWSRDLDDGGRNGYVENYAVYLIHAGLRGNYRLNRDVGFHSKVGLKVPMAISESVGLGQRGQGQRLDVSLSPGISPAFLIEGGSTIHGFDVALYFETWTLAKSAADPREFFQPDSTRKLFGIRVGHAFGFN
jgi:hypothetical protein